MKEGKCQKCRKIDFVEKHHILPTAAFGENDEKYDLCPNCHTKYHLFLGKKNLKNPSVEYHFEKFYHWLLLIPAIAFLLYFLF